MDYGAWYCRLAELAPDACLIALDPGRGHEEHVTAVLLLLWKLDRLGRSLRGVVKFEAPQLLALAIAAQALQGHTKSDHTTLAHERLAQTCSTCTFTSSSVRISCGLI